MSEKKKGEAPEDMQGHFDILKRIVAAQMILANDADAGSRLLAVEITMIKEKESERAEAMANSTVAFLLGMADELRDFVTSRIREINPNLLPSGDIPTARSSYEKGLKGFPETIEELNAATEGITAAVEVTHKVMKVDEEEGKELLALLSRLTGESFGKKGGAE